MREKLAESEAGAKAARLAHEQAAILAWSRDDEGRMVSCNAAYARAVEAADENAAVDQSAELFDPGLRREAAAALARRASGSAAPARWSGRAPNFRGRGGAHPVRIGRRRL